MTNQWRNIATKHNSLFPPLSCTTNFKNKTSLLQQCHNLLHINNFNDIYTPRVPTKRGEKVRHPCRQHWNLRTGSGQIEGLDMASLESVLSRKTSQWNLRRIFLFSTNPSQCLFLFVYVEGAWGYRKVTRNRTKAEYWNNILKVRDMRGSVYITTRWMCHIPINHKCNL